MAAASFSAGDDRHLTRSSFVDRWVVEMSLAHAFGPRRQLTEASGDRPHDDQRRAGGHQHESGHQQEFVAQSLAGLGATQSGDVARLVRRGAQQCCESVAADEARTERRSQGGQCGRSPRRRGELGVHCGVVGADVRIGLQCGQHRRDPWRRGAFDRRETAEIESPGADQAATADDLVGGGGRHRALEQCVDLVLAGLQQLDHVDEPMGSHLDTAGEARGRGRAGHDQSELTGHFVGQRLGRVTEDPMQQHGVGSPRVDLHAKPRDRGVERRRYGETLICDDSRRLVHQLPARAHSTRDVETEELGHQ